MSKIKPSHLIYTGKVQGIKKGFNIYCDGSYHKAIGLYGETLSIGKCDCKQEINTYLKIQ